MGNLYELLEIWFIYHINRDDYGEFIWLVGNMFHINMIIIFPMIFWCFFVEIGHLFRNCWDLMGILALKTPKIYLSLLLNCLCFRRFDPKKHGDVGPKHWKWYLAYRINIQKGEPMLFPRKRIYNKNKTKLGQKHWSWRVTRALRYQGTCTVLWVIWSLLRAGISEWWSIGIF